MLDRRLFLCVGIASAAKEDAAGQHETWRRERLARLTGDEGWLTVVGLHWLEPGVNRIASAPGITFTLRGKAVSFKSAEPVMLNGKPVRQAALKEDEDKVIAGDHTYFVIVRGKRVAIRERDKRSRFRTAFKGLEAYPFQPELRCVARWIPYPKPMLRRITTVANTIDQMMAPGQAEFAIAGKAYRLEPVIEEDHLFYIFKDLTAGKTTYPAGRFMEMPMPKDGRAIVDFNRAYNPPCAFTAHATCPLPLPQNRLPIAIEAGEKAYHLD